MTSLNVALRVIRAEKLAAKDKTGKSDPYVVITTTCDEDVVFRTTTIKQNLAPEWDDIFFFETYVLRVYVITVRMFLAVCVCVNG